jgi:hypothetical protein
MKLPIDHPGLPESYTPGELLPDRAPTLKQWVVAVIGGALITFAVVFVLGVIQYWPLIRDARALVLEAITTGAPACRIEVIDGIKVKHCIRTVWRF